MNLKNLEYACDRAAKHSLTILIEPLNCFDVPGYFLRTTTQAAEIIGDIGTANLKLMFDCYHVGRTERDVVGRLRDLYSIIGHIQFASVPDRGTPDQGEVDYQKVFATIDAIGWQAPVGAEYIPKGQTDASLAWMSRMALSD